MASTGVQQSTITNEQTFPDNSTGVNVSITTVPYHEYSPTDDNGGSISISSLPTTEPPTFTFQLTTEGDSGGDDGM